MSNPQTAAFATPDWVRDAVFYQIFPDRFARSDKLAKPRNLEPWDSPPTEYGFKGGDLLGVVEHLDYLEDLGITALYFNPIFKSAANHRYHTYDYYQVDPILGGNAAFSTLLDEAHRRGMRVVLDGVFNHASRGFFQFNHILENGAASPYLDWFSINGWPLHAYDTSRKPNYAAWWGLRALPKFNTNIPAVRAFLMDVAAHWVEQGIDGWRLDVPGEIDDDGFWRGFRQRVKAVNPQAYIVGEIWQNGRRWLQGDMFDAVMNYLLTKACLAFFIGRNLHQVLSSGIGYSPVEPVEAEGFASAVGELLAMYPQQVTQVQMNLLGSHDTARFLSLSRGDESALRLAVLFLMCYPGAPCVYYGDEVGMTGGKDPDCRRAFQWDEGRWNSELREYVKACIALRRDHPALCRGEVKTLYAKGMVFALGRRLTASEEHAGSSHEETLIAVFNTDKSPWDLDVPVEGYLSEGAVLQGLWGEGQASVGEGRLGGLEVPARRGVVLQLEG